MLNLDRNNLPLLSEELLKKQRTTLLTTLSLGYGGLLSQNHQDNSVNAGFTWRF